LGFFTTFVHGGMIVARVLAHYFRRAPEEEITGQ
jgi:hypothetical protein